MHSYFHEQKPKAMRNDIDFYSLCKFSSTFCFTHAVAIKVSPPVYQCICIYSAVECH